MTKPTNPSPLRNVVTMRQLDEQSVSDTINATIATEEKLEYPFLTAESSEQTTKTNAFDPFEAVPVHNTSVSSNNNSTTQAPLLTTTTNHPQTTSQSDPMSTLPPLVKKPLWHQTNLALRSTNKDIDDRAHRRAEKRVDQEYSESMEVTKELFREGKEDCVLTTNEMIEKEMAENQAGNCEKSAWEEVYKSGYRPWGERE